MEASTTQTIAVCAFALILWRLLSSLAKRSYLSHIPGPPRYSWWKGNADKFFSLKEGWTFQEELYRNYGSVSRLDMLLGEQQLYVSDPLALHHIFVKNQYIYEETDEFLTTFQLMFGPNLMASLGDAHKKQRKMLNPVFSLKHMRDLLPIFNPIAHKLREVLETDVLKDKDYIDVMNWVSRAALEYIGQGGLGYSFEALDEAQTNAYSEALKSYTSSIFKLNFFRQFAPAAMKVASPSVLRRVVEMIPSRLVKKIVELTDTIEIQSKGILQGKRQALEEGDEAVHSQIGRGKDVISILMKANSVNGVTHVPEKELLAHMSTFIVAGHDTTTSAICRVLHILSAKQDVQTKLRDEVTAARKGHEDLDYDELMALPFLDAVCRETLRVYPPVNLINRVARKDIVLPLLWPIKATDGKTEIKEIALKKNTILNVSVLGANRSKAIWGEDAEEWKPERWLKPQPKSVDDAHLPGVYSQMMTFIGGGRACIGFKFAEMEMKLVLSTLIEKFVFEPGPEIVWQMSGIQHPVVKGEEGHEAKVPLKVSIVGK